METKESSGLFFDQEQVNGHPEPKAYFSKPVNKINWKMVTTAEELLKIYHFEWLNCVLLTLLKRLGN